MKRLLATVFGLLLGTGCREPAGSPPDRRLPHGAVALVADQTIASETVRRVAAAQGLSSRLAREHLLSDALFALEGRAVLPAALTRGIERSAAARALLEQIAEQARSEGPPSDAEVEALSAERWAEVDRPTSARTAHAVALRDKAASAEPARRVAEAIREAVAGATDPEEFLERTRSVPAADVQVRAERLPPVTADGRTFSPEGAPGPLPRFDPDFARAANALLEPGETSAVVETAFGFHVILLVERLPERRISFEERRAAFAAEIQARRAAGRRTALLAGLKQATPVTVAREVDTLTATLVPRP